MPPSRPVGLELLDAQVISMLKSWCHRSRPNLVTIEAVLGHLSYGFVTSPTAGTLPPEIVEALRPIAERIDLTVPDAIRLTAEVAYREHHPKALRV